MTTLLTQIESLDPALVARIKRIAHAEGQAKNWRTFADNFIIKSIMAATGGADLRPKDVARQLGCSKWTVCRDIAAGRYPNAYWKNSRVVYIPQSDVDAIKKNPVMDR